MRQPIRLFALLVLPCRAGDWPQMLGRDRKGIVLDETVIAPANGQKPKAR